VHLKPQQIQELLEVISTNQAILLGTHFGTDFLTRYDKSLLTRRGVDYNTIYSESKDHLLTSFHLGMLAQSLKDVRAMKKLNYETLRQYIKDGQYIPITKKELDFIDSLKSQTFSDIRTLNSKIFQDINGILSNIQSQEDFLKKEIEEGVEGKRTYKEIAKQIARKTGDWNRNFERIVNYQANTAYQHGRVAFIEREHGPQTQVYKKPRKTACKHCIKAYLTNGLESEPKVFTLEEIRKNGNNIGKRVDE
jgi:hypothetical protein